MMTNLGANTLHAEGIIIGLVLLGASASADTLQV